MSGLPRILIFAGGMRRESFNRRLARVAAQQTAAAGIQATLLELADYPLPQHSGYLPFSGKPAALRGLRHLREVHTELQMIVLPKQVSLPAANHAFDSEGRLTDPAAARRLGELVAELPGMAGRLAK